MTIDQADYHLDLEEHPTHGWLRARWDEGGQIGMLLDRERMVALRDELTAMIGRLPA